MIYFINEKTCINRHMLGALMTIYLLSCLMATL